MIDNYSQGRVLLDTHTFVWASLEPEKLSPLARKICESPNYELLVSVVSLWEVVVKVQVGKWAIDDPVRWFEKNMQRLSAEWVNVRPRDAAQVYALPLLHRDPFDRILIAQSRVESVPLITGDRDIHRYKGINAVW